MSSRSFESLMSSRDSSEDCRKNYDIVKPLGGSLPPDVYLATCRRGRLRRRTVVLKKVIATESVLGSVAIHQSLYHPAVLSLFSTFPAADSDSEPDRRSQPAITARHIVLEHAGPHGTLSDHLPRLNPASTEESRVRGVLKTLVDALTYLEKENVVHRRLVPDSVYVTEDFRVKLGGFDDAIRIPADGDDSRVDVPPRAECPRHHLAPEIKAGERYDCSSDIWSLGTLILWMLDPSRDPTVRIGSVGAKGELGSLVSQLTEKDPERRIKVWDISHHPFLDPKFPVQNLDPNPRPTERQNDAARPTLRKIREFDRGNKGVAPSRKPFGDLTNLLHPSRDLKQGDPHTNSQDHFRAGPSTSILPPVRVGQVDRRTVSDPVYGTKERRKFLDPIEEAGSELENEERSIPPVKARLRSKSAAAVIPPFLQARGYTPTPGDDDSRNQAEEFPPESSLSDIDVPAKEGGVKEIDNGMNTEELLRDFEEAFHSPPTSSVTRQAAPARRIKSILDTVIPESHSTPAAAKPIVIRRHVSPSPPADSPTLEPPHHPFDNLPSKGVGTPRPKPFNSAFLPPQTHKVARGQLVVLPSRGLLVDFREGERRQGRQGVEVLTISPNGEEVSVFSAPHMSTPCCLAEPSAIYRLGDLPKPYWKLYEAAGKLVEQIKQHVPRLVLYEPDSKFALMTNFPDADVEAVFFSPEGFPRVQPGGKGELCGKATGGFPPRGASMRVRIMQSRQLVEISRQVLAPARDRGRAVNPSSKGLIPREEEGEWKKVVLVAPGGNIGAIDRTSLDAFERNGLERTKVFLATCRTVESGLVDAQEFLNREVSLASNSLSSVLVCKTLPVDQLDDNIPGEPESINLARKFGIPRHPTTSTASVPSVLWNKDSRGFPFEPPSLTREPGGFETRFIPSVGWCVRYAGSSGGAGRYRMMFFDGKTLEVDVDEECVELMDSIRDEVVRYKIRECSSKREIMEKMRAFKEFVSMFDDGSDTE